MRAVQINEYGPAENLKLVDVPIPEPAEDEVLIKVEAASVIFADSLMRRGIYLNLPSSLPFIPGERGGWHCGEGRGKGEKCQA